MTDFGVTDTAVGGCRLVEVRGEVDLYTAPLLRQELLRIVGEGATRLVVDLNAATFVDSFVVGVLLGALRRVREVGGALVLSCGPGSGRRIFELMSLDRLFTIVDDRDEALAAARSAGGAEGVELPAEPAEDVV